MQLIPFLVWERLRPLAHEVAEAAAEQLISRHVECDDFGVRPLRHGLEEGLSGIVLLLAAVGAGKTAHTAALHKLLRRLCDTPSRSLGLFTGWSGTLAAVAYAQQSLGAYTALSAALRSRIASAAAQQFAEGGEAPRESHEVDVISGAAGIALALHSSPEACNSVPLPYLARLARDIDGYLNLRLHGDIASGPGPCLGIAHGLAGIGLALATEDRFHFAALEIFDRLLKEQICSSGVPAWPRYAGGPSAYARKAWCHGTLGIALALGIAGEVLQQARFRAVSSDAIGSIVMTRRDGDMGLCHGIAGELLVLNVLHGLLLRDDLAECVQIRLGAFLENLHALVRQSLSDPRPGLLSGMTGAVLCGLTLTGFCSPTWLRVLGVSLADRFVPVARG